MADPNYDGFGRQATNPENEMPAASTTAPARSGTLKKKNSIKRKGSVKRSSSRAGSVRSVQMDQENKNSIFYTPVPTRTNPTEALVGRFTAWRKVLKDYIAYFREIQSQYEARSRGISKVTATLNQATMPTDFLTSGGILETNNVLRDFHHEVTANSQFAAQIETDIIKNLIGLRNDLSHKIKEIKGLSGDFKNNIDKEKETMKKEVAKLQDELETMNSNPAGGKDPYVTRVTVEKQLRHYLTEENYLHRAYLNLESSGRELERIVVGEIQKSYNVYVGILAKEGRELIDVSERLTATTLHLPPDYEWNAFVERDTKMVNPKEKLRSFDEIEYPGCHHPAALEVKAGTLERKSKYLKSFTAGWYVLSPTHLHEFKTEDRGRDTSPVLSLYLPDSTLGKHSDAAAVSHKFVVKGKQTGAMHRGHSWVFRAETHEAMMDWYEAIKKLTEITGRERDTFVAGVAQRQRAVSSASKGDLDSNSSEYGLDNDEADEVPYSGRVSNVGHPQEDEEILQPPVRPEGGRFPSDINVNRSANQAESLSGESGNEAVANVSAQPGAVGAFGAYDPQQAYAEDQYQAQQAQQAQESQQFSEEPSYAKQTALMSGAAVTGAAVTGAAVTGAAMSGGAQDSTYENVQPPQDTNAYSTPPDAQNSTYVASQSEQPNYPTQTSTLEETRGGDHIVFMNPVHTTNQREQEPLPADNYPTDQTDQTAPRPDMSNLATYSQQRVNLADTSHAPSQSAGIYDTRDGPQVSETGNTLGFETLPVVSDPNQASTAPSAGGVQEQEHLAPDGRPTSLRGDSMNTISNLHVPGEYPRKT